MTARWHGSWVDFGFNYPTAGANAGGYFGQAIAGSPLADYESRLGKPIAITHFGTQWSVSGASSPFSAWSSRLQVSVTAGKIPFIDWGPWDLSNHSLDGALSYANIINGATAMMPDGSQTIDAYLTAWANAARIFGHDFFLRIFHEFTAQWANAWPWALGTGRYPGTGGSFSNYNNTPAQHIAAWRHIVKIFRAAGATNVNFVWCPNVQPAPRVWILSDVYPGDDVVDWLSYDGYTSGVDQDWDQIMRGTAARTPVSFIFDTYSELLALSPHKPIMLAETNLFGARIQNLVSIVANGTTWVVTTSAATIPYAPGMSVQIVGTTPTGYNVLGVITAATTNTSFTIANTTTPGAITTLGQVYSTDRTTRAAKYADLFANVIPNLMPAVQAIVWFWVFYDLTNWTSDWNGLTVDATRADFAAFANGMEDSDVIAGAQFALPPDLSYIQPYNLSDQPDRYRQAIRSAPGLVLYARLNEAASPAIDDTGNHTITTTGTPSFGAANLLLGKPTETSVALPGNVAHYLSSANHADFELITTGQYTVELLVLIASAPSATQFIVAKSGTSGQFSWQVTVSATALSFVVNQSTGGTYLSLAVSLAALLGAPHHLVFTFDRNVSPQAHLVIDGNIAGKVASADVGGALTTTTGPLYIGRRGDSVGTTGAFVGNVAHIALYNTVKSDVSIAHDAAAWIAGPTISAVVAA